MNLVKTALRSGSSPHGPWQQFPPSSGGQYLFLNFEVVLPTKEGTNLPVRKTVKEHHTFKNTIKQFMITYDDEHFMRQALYQAQLAYDADEVPVGAIVVQQNKIIGRGYNQVEMLSDATAHAEMIALTAAFGFLGAKYLPEATLYVSVEPCPMCAGALYWSKIGRIVYGASDAKNGYQAFYKNEFHFHPKTTLATGILHEECGRLIQQFFREKRKKW